MAEFKGWGVPLELDRAKILVEQIDIQISDPGKYMNGKVIGWKM